MRSENLEVVAETQQGEEEESKEGGKKRKAQGRGNSKRSRSKGEA